MERAQETYEVAEQAPVPSVPQQSARAPRRARPDARPRKRREGHRLRDLAITNLIVVGLIWFLLDAVSERWWIGYVLTYAPRAVLLLPSLVLLLLSAKFDRPTFLVNLLSTWLVAGPVMGLSLPLGKIALAEDDGSGIRVVTCNVQGPGDEFEQLMREVARMKPPALVVLQDLHESPPILQSQFEGWHIVHEGGFWVASRYPARLLGTCHAEAFDRVSAIAVEIDAPDGAFVLVNVHQTSAIPGLDAVTPDALLRGRIQERIHEHEQLRQQEAQATRTFVSKLGTPLPKLVMGDFGMPTSSRMFETYWGDLRNAFDVAGIGYGYTSPYRSTRLWPDNVPWFRGDHILATWHWRIHKCQVGQQSCSEHRLLFARIGRR